MYLTQQGKEQHEINVNYKVSLRWIHNTYQEYEPCVKIWPILSDLILWKFINLKSTFFMLCKL